jgi:hypothetical protein
MKTTLLLSSILLFVFACKKNPGVMVYKAKYSTEASTNKTSNKTEAFHSDFGTYITSITPTHFSCKMSMLVFQDHYNYQDKSCHMVSFVDGHDNQPGYEIASYADFSGNAEVEVTPILYSTDMMDGLFEQKEVNFRFLTFVPIYFDHTFTIPYQYLSIAQNSATNNFLTSSTFQFNTSEKTITVCTKKEFSYGAIHGKKNAMPTSFRLVFGNTATSYIYSYSGNNLSEEERFPFWDQTGGVTIRSNKYSLTPIVMPDKGKSNTMYSTISFYTNDLIQVYAGDDNIAYTADDVFVYAPSFWERMNVNLKTIN